MTISFSDACKLAVQFRESKPCNAMSFLVLKMFISSLFGVRIDTVENEIKFWERKLYAK